MIEVTKTNRLTGETVNNGGFIVPVLNLTFIGMTVGGYIIQNPWLFGIGFALVVIKFTHETVY